MFNYTPFSASALINSCNKIIYILKKVKLNDFIL